MDENTLGKIAVYATISVVVGAIASRAGRKKARAVLAGDQAALDSLPKVDIPVPPGIPEALVAELQGRAQAAAASGDWASAAGVFWGEGKKYPRRSPEREYLNRRGGACYKVAMDLRSAAMQWVFVPIGIALLAVFVWLMATK